MHISRHGACIFAGYEICSVDIGVAVIQRAMVNESGGLSFAIGV